MAGLDAAIHGPQAASPVFMGGRISPGTNEQGNLNYLNESVHYQGEKTVPIFVHP